METVQPKTPLFVNRTSNIVLRNSMHDIRYSNEYIYDIHYKGSIFYETIPEN